MLIVLEEAFMREGEGEMDGEVVELESAFVWLCGWRSCEDKPGALRLAPVDPPEREDDILSAK
jgi:hypothetical protein